MSDLEDLKTRLKIAKSKLQNQSPEKNNKSLPQDQIDQMLIESLSKHSVKNAVTAVALETSLPRRALYQRAILLKSERNQS